MGTDAVFDPVTEREFLGLLLGALTMSNNLIIIQKDDFLRSQLPADCRPMAAPRDAIFI